MAYIVTSDVDGSDLGTFRTKREALAAVAAYDTPARKAAFTKRLTGAHMTAGRKAAATRAKRAAAEAKAVAAIEARMPGLKAAAMAESVRIRGLIRR